MSSLSSIFAQDVHAKVVDLEIQRNLRSIELDIVTENNLVQKDSSYSSWSEKARLFKK
jgi:hypothetical protein